MTERLSYRVLYLNGLDRKGVGVSQDSFSRRLKSSNVHMTHMAVDWHSDLTFQELFDRTTERAEQEIRQHGRLALVGASAGGSLGVNVFQRLRSDQPYSDVSLVSLSGRLRVGDQKDFNGDVFDCQNNQPSAAYIESVAYCEKTAIPKLLESDKQSMRTVHPLADQVVPLDTMGIDGVEAYVVPVDEHLRGIACGVRLIPKILDDIYVHQQQENSSEYHPPQVAV